MKTISISKLFPNYRLSKEDAAWVFDYFGMTGFEPFGTDEVNDKISFVEMMKSNVKWFENWGMETHAIIDKAMRKTVVYNEVEMPA